MLIRQSVSALPHLILCLWETLVKNYNLLIENNAENSLYQTIEAILIKNLLKQLIQFRDR